MGESRTTHEPADDLLTLLTKLQSLSNVMICRKLLLTYAASILIILEQRGNGQLHWATC